MKLKGLLFLLTTLVGFASPLNAATEQAKSADEFVNFIGINTHLPQDNAYRDFPLIKSTLQDLGILHARDNAWNHNKSDYYSNLQELSALGIKFTLFFHGQSPEEAVQITKKLAGTVEALEGANETDLGDLSPLSYKDLSYPESTRTYQNDLYSAFKADPDTRHLPVLMPSVGWGKNSETIGSLESGDIGNMHSYPDQGNRPEIHLDDWYIPFARKIVGDSKPLWTTETGYGTLPDHPLGVSETAAAKYLPRLLFEHWNRNIKRVYLYQLIDPNPPGTNRLYEHTGLLRNDGTRKPTYPAIKNLIDVLKEPGANFSPGTLDYSLTGDTDTVHRTLLQKSNKEFYLVLWQETNSWNPATDSDIDVSNRTVTLTSANTCSAVAYRPTESNRGVNLASAGGAITLGVPDHPLVVNLKPCSSPASPVVVPPSPVVSPSPITPANPVVVPATEAKCNLVPKRRCKPRRI